MLRLLFRRLFLNYLEQAFDAGELQFFSSLEPLRNRHAFLRHIAPTRKINWKVYAKPPFGGSEQVLKYVARYTHRVAISNDRLLGLDDGKVQFRWKDYRDNSRHKTMTLVAWGAGERLSGRLAAFSSGFALNPAPFPPHNNRCFRNRCPRGSL